MAPKVYFTLGLMAIFVAGCVEPLRAPLRLQECNASDEKSFLSFTNEVGCNQSWLSESQLTNALAKEWFIISNQDSRQQHQKLMIELQEQADILLELADSEHLKILRSNIPNFEQNAIFPITNLNKFIIEPRHGKQIECVAVILPHIYSGESPEIELIRDMDSVLCTGGVKHRVFEIRSYGFWIGFQFTTETKK